MSRTVIVTTGARLHFGPLSFRPQQGRHFGGVGVMIDEPGFRLAFRPTGQDRVANETASAVRVRQFVSRFREACPPEHELPRSEVEILGEVPSHNGLGSGTQLGLAVARGLSTLANEPDVEVIELARRVGRGRRSAVGIYGFADGGLVVDAGQSPGEAMGALACRLAVPQEWRVVLLTPHERNAGLSGEGEERAFDALGPMPITLTERLCRIVLTDLLPAVQTAAFEAFSDAVNEYGRLVGEFFAPVQGGMFGHPRADSLIAELKARGIVGAGQTSWGPTVFAFVSDDDAARRIVSMLHDSADIRVVTPRNHGAIVDVSEQ